MPTALSCRSPPPRRDPVKEQLLTLPANLRSNRNLSTRPVLVWSCVFWAWSAPHHISSHTHCARTHAARCPDYHTAPHVHSTQCTSLWAQHALSTLTTRFPALRPHFGLPVPFEIWLIRGELSQSSGFKLVVRLVMFVVRKRRTFRVGGW